MTPEQMMRLMRDRAINHAARRFPWQAVSVPLILPRQRDTENYAIELANAACDQAELMYAIWTAVNIQAWLLRWRGQQYAAVLRIWRFAFITGQIDMDLVIGEGGRHRQFKVRVALMGDSDMLNIRIVGWDNSGREEVVWNRVGCIISPDSGPCIVTLPEGGADGQRRRQRTGRWNGAAA